MNGLIYKIIKLKLVYIENRMRRINEETIQKYIEN